MSGHSKWAQIKHKKALTDAKKGKIFSKMARLISIAAKEKGADPAMNPKLRMAVETARSAGMPKENVTRAIERAAGAGAKENLEEVRYEAYGPEGTALLIFGVTDSRNRTTNEIKHLLSENDGKLAAEGSVSWMFKKTGAVDFPKETIARPLDDFVLKLIEAGAEDVREFAEGYTAYVDPAALDTFKARLAEKKIPAGEPHIDYVPQNPISVPPEAKAKLEKLEEQLDEHDDIQEVFTNMNDE
ncbi:MAG: YebC/PmpR family DNA-binding transcriptional regulator [Candidatus Sungbacteria bacterium]|nr:YebC/PmpR family DNA-binding transcriptional regulator [Candidatus Sungbacteria bacterium]